MTTSPLSRVGPLSRLGLATTGEADAASSSNRKAVLGVAVLAALLLAVCARFVLGAGTDEQTVVAAPAVAAQPGSGAAAAPSPAPSLRFPDAEQVRNGRNPFEVLHAASTTGVSGPATGAAAPATPDLPPPVDAPAAPGAVGESGRAGAPAVVPPAGAPATRRLALLRTAGTPQAATGVFTLDGVEQVVGVGESFGPSGELLLLSLQEGPEPGQWTAVVQVGQGDPFDVVTGAPAALP